MEPIRFLPLDQPVSEWGNDKTLCTSEKLVLVLEVDVGDRYHALVGLLDEREARLFLPLEVERRLDVLGTLQQIIHDIVHHIGLARIYD